MACDSFGDCVSDPLVENNLPARDTFATLSTTAVFAINLTLFILYTALIIAVVYFILKGIYSIINADSADAFEKFRGAITNSVFAAVGIVLLFSTRFLFITVLGLIGIPADENLFINLPF